MKRNGERGAFAAMGTLRLSRRSFVRNLTLLGGGAVAYASPNVKAAAKMLSAAQTTGAVFDIQLPANYNIDVPSNLLTVQLASGQKTNVDFRVKGALVLNKTAMAGIADVRVNALTLNSNQPEPLSALGLKTGPIVAEVPGGTVLGRLNLKTGALQQATVPVKVSLPTYSASNAGNNPSQTKTVEQQATRAVGGDKCVIRDIKVDVSLPKTTRAGGSTPAQGGDLVPASTTTGTLKLGFIPVK